MDPSPCFGIQVFGMVAAAIAQVLRSDITSHSPIPSVGGCKTNEDCLGDKTNLDLQRKSEPPAPKTAFMKTTEKDTKSPKWVKNNDKDKTW
ncbi:hypothetical protein AVEN_239563-1 [Araneus ventricosus]|uniref:Uncharacterized protein n=1 Tax=Araneus ventricosus TaxID=182803 RepID=A0A4Y2QQR7_ARAVE|nr:hypothetical protein AVEN_239563-1 [Araneus ventricosus]